MQEHYGENLNLKSVLGSSAGSILGLGFTCKIPVETISYHCIHNMRKIAEMDKACKEVNREEEREYLKILGDFLVDYGILD